MIAISITIEAYAAIRATLREGKDFVACFRTVGAV